MRQPRAGRPSALARLLAVLVVLGMVAVTAPVLVPVVRWFVGQL
jgi:hypothetical protein